MALTQPTTSEMHQVEQEILAQPSAGKKKPMSRINSDAILNKLQTSTPHSSLHLGAIQGPSCTLQLGSQHEHLAQNGP
jgi:hypothetical protein